MCKRFSDRAKRLEAILHEQTQLKVHKPQSGMFALVSVSATGMSGKDYAMDLLINGGVGGMPGSSSGKTFKDWVRISLSETDTLFDEGCRPMAAHANANSKS